MATMVSIRCPNVGLLQVFHIVLDGVLGPDVEEFRKVFDDNHGGCHIQQVMRKLLEGCLVGYLIALLDVAFQDVVHEGAHIAFVVLDGQQLGEATLFQIVIKGRPAESFSLGGTTHGIHLFHNTELIERERIKGNLLVAAREVRGQLTTEQLGVGASDNHVHLLPKHTVHEEVPAVDVLYFVKEEVLEVAINLIEHLQHIVQLFCLDVGQPLVVEVDVGKLAAIALHRLVAECRLAAAPHAYHHLRLSAFQVDERFFAPVAQCFLRLCFEFLLLVGENEFQCPFVYHIFIKLRCKDMKYFSHTALFCKFT